MDGFGRTALLTAPSGVNSKTCVESTACSVLDQNFEHDRQADVLEIER